MNNYTGAPPYPTPLHGICRRYLLSVISTHACVTADAHVCAAR